MRLEKNAEKPCGASVFFILEQKRYSANWNFKTGALNHSATLPSLEFRGLAKPRGGGKGRLPPDCHRQRVILFSVCASGSEGSFHDLGGAVVRLREEVSVDRQGDCRGTVAHAPADRKDVESGSD
jgi:hypothetical protein